MELFRELQLLKTDYLRQRALYSVQELVTKFLTEEGVAQEAMAAKVTICLYAATTAMCCIK